MGLASNNIERYPSEHRPITGNACLSLADGQTFYPLYLWRVLPHIDLHFQLSQRVDKCFRITINRARKSKKKKKKKVFTPEPGLIDSIALQPSMCSRFPLP